MGHVILLGDSVFDNAAYVAGGPDVVRQLRDVLPAGWRATLGAVDGSVTTGVARQLEWLPGDATHLIVSVGGNDALQASDILTASAASTAEALLKLAAVRDQFEFNYRQMMGHLLARRLPIAVCTIYYPRFPDETMQRLAVAALASFNDCIIRAAFAAGLPLLDLRLICSDDEDYANPIEPSVRGGEKIAAAIRTMLAAHDFTRGRTEVFV